MGQPEQHHLATFNRIIPKNILFIANVINEPGRRRSVRNMIILLKLSPKLIMKSIVWVGLEEKILCQLLLIINEHF